MARTKKPKTPPTPLEVYIEKLKKDLATLEKTQKKRKVLSTDPEHVVQQALEWASDDTQAFFFEDLISELESVSDEMKSMAEEQARTSESASSDEGIEN
jgi:hypothetical protein